VTHLIPAERLPARRRARGPQASQAENQLFGNDVAGEEHEFAEHPEVELCELEMLLPTASLSEPTSKGENHAPALRLAGRSSRQGRRRRA
jgi:hypothetical protein